MFNDAILHITFIGKNLSTKYKNKKDKVQTSTNILYNSNAISKKIILPLA